MKKTLATSIAWVVMTVVSNCTVMDDNSVPKERFNQIEISDFEVNIDRDYIRGKIQNNSDLDITSSIFTFELYSGNFGEYENNKNYLQSSIAFHAGPDSLSPSKLLLSQNFVVREPLKPNYSTEFYFELKMDYDISNFLYTHEIFQIKGR